MNNEDIIKWLEKNAAKYASFTEDFGDGGDVIYYTQKMIKDLRKFIGEN